MPLLDFSEHRGTEAVITRFRNKYPVLDSDAVNSIVLSQDGGTIGVFLYEEVTLPATFEGLTVRTHI